MTNQHDKEIPKERYVYPEKRQEFIDELRLKIIPRMIKKYPKKVIYIQKKNYKSIIMEYQKNS